MKVIKRTCLPTRLPIIGTVVAYIFLDHINAPQVVWGAVGVVYLIGWIATVVTLFKCDYIDIFKKADK